MILFQNVTKIYEDRVIALNDATFHINKGEFVFITGPSGAGKSTLTKLITHEETPDSGKITVADFDVTSLPAKKVPYLRRSMGIVFQDFRLLPKKTVYENVAFAMEVVGASSRQIRRRVPDVLSMVGLTNKAKSYPDQLSGGEQQRVGIARALANKPHILIADEPTGNLDNDTAWEIMSILDHINKQGTTVLMVTHAQNIVDEMQKRVITIENGIVTCPEEELSYV
ncbi:MAG: cell division ATP-binding protein FtsE [Clostridia bacterium]|nr:cell division ATP-binding protein FtsE [Clostridia bacterium]